MSRKSRKAQRRRKWERRLAHRAVSPADAMHEALGEFLTEMGRVEFRMLLMVDLISEPPLEALFPEYAGNPFGPKIKWFKKYCDNYGVPANQKAALQQIYKDLEELRVKRNFIVHGETWNGDRASRTESG